jgi:hypothetical protein
VNGTNQEMVTNRVSDPDARFAGEPPSWEEPDAGDELRGLVGRVESAGSAPEKLALMRSLLERMETVDRVPGDVIARIDQLARGSVDPDVIALGLRARVRARSARMGIGATERWSRMSLDVRLRAQHTRASRRQPPRRIPAASLDLRYDIDWSRPLGVGGFAASFAAVERGTGRRVVIKRAHAPHSDRFLGLPEPVKAGMVAEFRERFRREARGLELSRERRVRGVVGLVEHGELVDPFVAARDGAAGTAPYLVTDRVEGRSLSYLLKVYPDGLPVAASLHWGAQLLRILGDLHDVGLLHRDVKPGNVMFASQPDTELVDALDDHPERVRELPDLVLIDFGAAVSFRDERLSRLGFTPPYTEDYAPIEQRQRQLSDRQGPWTDVHAAGVVMLDMLAGHRRRRACFKALRSSRDEGVPVDRKVAIRRLLAGQRAAVVSPVVRAVEPWPGKRTRAARPLASSLQDCLRSIRRGKESA